ncbi:N-acetylmuramic acid 6-phosphate etherase [Aurantimonas sp. MSK8Z-1]|uniref:N-acetylmuramic acid 6-phosphate etherase n=1 Tax=Mangrovibrevibacter kandeliae TaxID=2968473 RepID=UPI002118C134|nr:N-acetylmuramic acid 6-phosphate etherase [Aurantimonas sp. MSK8Z-1]MCW4114236.1 N-acetylmuramic acid 6-phosphate etherase [Aurantimonas sp. MSK8Z-1]
MAPNRTEMLHDQAAGLDMLEPADVARRLATAQCAAAGVVAGGAEALAAAAELGAAALAGPGRLVYAGAGSSGLMALADALELPGTFGIDRERVVVLFAGAPQTLNAMTGGAEDDVDLAASDVGAAGIGPEDCVIAVSASGSTPYTLAALKAAGARGARTIAIANNAGAPLLEAADAPVLLATPPELLAGSTRMGAGTAQKIALNVLSTLIALKLGHIHDGLMVNVTADNAKLRTRAVGIVARLSGAGEPEAADAIGRAGGSVKHAILIAAGAADRADAHARLTRAGMRVRPALAGLTESSSSRHGGAKS